MVGKVVDLFFVEARLLGLGLEFFQLFAQAHALGAFGGAQARFDAGDGRAVAALLLVQVVRADAGDGVRGVAVHVDERLEAVLFAAVKQPVDGALLVGLAVVGEEIVEEIGADDLARRAAAAQRLGDEAEVVFQRLFAIGRLEEAHEHADDVVLEVFIVADGEDAVAVGGEVGSGQWLVVSGQWPVGSGQ